jgi:hypothetical protein
MPSVSCIGMEDHHAPAISVASSDVVLQSTMATQVEQLQGILAWIGTFLERVEAVLSQVSFLLAMLKTTPAPCPPCDVSVDFLDDRGDKLYGSFAPRVGDNSSPLSLYSMYR